MKKLTQAQTLYLNDLNNKKHNTAVAPEVLAEVSEMGLVQTVIGIYCLTPKGTSALKYGYAS